MFIYLLFITGNPFSVKNLTDLNPPKLQKFTQNNELMMTYTGPQLAVPLEPLDTSEWTVKGESLDDTKPLTLPVPDTSCQLYEQTPTNKSAQLANEDTNTAFTSTLILAKREITSSSKLMLLHFRGSRFSQCFIPSTALHYLLPSKLLSKQLFWVVTNSVHCL